MSGDPNCWCSNGGIVLLPLYLSHMEQWLLGGSGQQSLCHISSWWSRQAAVPLSIDCASIAAISQLKAPLPPWPGSSISPASFLVQGSHCWGNTESTLMRETSNNNWPSSENMLGNRGHTWLNCRKAVLCFVTAFTKRWGTGPTRGGIRGEQ